MVAKETGYGPVLYLKYTEQVVCSSLLKIGPTSILKRIASLSPGHLRLSNLNVWLIHLNYHCHLIVSKSLLPFSMSYNTVY